MPLNDSRRSLLALEQESTLIAVIELSQSSWLVAGIVPGLERHPLKKLEPDEDALLRLLQRWRDEAGRAGRTIGRLTIAFEAGRDGFWLARWLRARDIEAYVIHASSVGTAAMLQWSGSPRSQPRKARLSSSVSSRSVLARRCSRGTGTLEAWMT